MNTLCVLPDGSVQCLYTEAIDLASLGRMQIQRATSIEFDNPAQLWRVFDRRGREVYSSASRQDCLRWEVQHVAEYLEGG
jgi:hypothetical protein